MANLENARDIGQGIFRKSETSQSVDTITEMEALSSPSDGDTVIVKDLDISEAKQYLANTDYKMLPNYVPKPDEDLDAIVVKRNETREFIRNNNA